MMKKRTETLDAAFKKRFFALSTEQNNRQNDESKKWTLRKGTIKALAQRRDSLFGTKSPLILRN